jgi:hypothetical protein
MPALVCATLLLWVPPAALAATVLVVMGAATVAGFEIARPNRVVLYSLLATCILVAGLHLFRLVAA